MMCKKIHFKTYFDLGKRTLLNKVVQHFGKQSKMRIFSVSMKLESRHGEPSLVKRGNSYSNPV